MEATLTVCGRRVSMAPIVVASMCVGAASGVARFTLAPVSLWQEALVIVGAELAIFATAFLTASTPESHKPRA